MKNPVLENNTRLIVWWLVWLIIGLGQSFLLFFAYGSILNISLLDGISSLIIYSGITLAMWYPFSFINNGRNSTTIIATNLFIIGVISVGVWLLVSRTIMITLLPDDIGYKSFWLATLPYRIGTGIFIYCLVILTYYLSITLKNLAEKDSREARLESIVKETELQMLRSQINPHFLFNSLNSISSLTITDPEKAREMVIKLSEFMRYSLSKKIDQSIPLRKELENLGLYLEIEKVRFGKRLITEEYIDEECLYINIPNMLLQPLYENAIKHGVYESTEIVRITTRIGIKDEYMIIEISNDFDPDFIPLTGTGTGLMNVRRRMELSYGKSGYINTRKENNIFSVILYIPVSS
jgi:two-component system, LytTR family, sensor kinase